MEPCLDEQDMSLPTGTESLQDIAHIQPCPEDHPGLEPSTIEEVQIEGGHHPLPGDRDKEQDMLPIGTKYLQDTVHIEPCPNNDPVLVLAATNEVQGSYDKETAIGTTATSGTRYRTPYTRGSAKQKQK
ncbi:Hypothetical predicted protein [Olea europaea subsp. europaea]|uniref:Uncharacterized protein n=1 Tax=Olea europaea subsp. europaea TaxID=158383 RepID=A0A8S0PJ10_OLEEU|nr:Hypothetical predicted protein [Olea europaea subsp. europaea]